MTRFKPAIAVTTVLVLTAGVQAQEWIEPADAQEFPAGPAQVVTGCGPLRSISGGTNTGVDDFVDAYLIRVVDPLGFHATTSAAMDPEAMAAWDTRLFLFRTTGEPVLANDDTPGAGSQSFLSDPAGFPGAVDGTAAPLDAGDYVLVISGWNNDPEDAALVDLFGMNSDFDALFGPDPSAGLFDHWENGHGLVFSGDYTIALAGASFISNDDCPEDFDGGGSVDFQDLLVLLAAWGPCAGCPADLDCSGEVEFQDLLALLAAWGPCS